METNLLQDMLVIFLLSVGVLLICVRLRMPSVVGLFATGLLVGPHGLGLIQNIHQVELFAEIGTVLLLFAIGIEFSFIELLRLSKVVLGGGSLQVAATTGLIAFGWRALGHSWTEGIFLGFLVALSSTAIALKVLQDRNESDSLPGRVSLGILIFQDIAIIPMMLLVPLLAGTNNGGGEPLSTIILKIVAVLAAVWFGSQWLVPRLLHQVARQKSRELFLFAIAGLGMAIAWLTAEVGLSLALGAFLAGLIISESEYSHQALSNVLPFRDLFVSFFFLSVGMLLNLDILLSQALLVAVVALGLLLFKTVLVAAVVFVLGYSLRVAIISGLTLSQIGEFSFVLSGSGLQNGIISPEMIQIFMAAAVLTMAITPLSIAWAPRLADAAAGISSLRRFFRDSEHSAETGEVQQDHLVIIGYGLNGRNLARAAQVAGIPYLVLDVNPEIVKKERQEGIPIRVGDATYDAVLEAVQIDTARVVVVAVSDPQASARIVSAIRRHTVESSIIVRTRYVDHIGPLYRAGADYVIPEEYETSIEIFALVLQKYLVPRQQIEELVTEIRSSGYRMLRSLPVRSASLNDLKPHMHDAEISSIEIEQGAEAAGRSLMELGLRECYGINVLLIRRNTEVLSNPKAGAVLEAGDVVVLFGAPADIARGTRLFRRQG